MPIRPALPLVALFLIALAAAVSAPRPVAAESEPQKVVTQAKWTFERMLDHPEMGSLRRTIPDARGVLIFPSVLKGAFVFGLEGGTGVMLARQGAGGWSHPAFFTVGAASFGLQIGGEAKEIVLLLMNQEAVNAVIASEVKLGGDVSVSMGPIGAGLEGSTTTAVGADIVAYSLSKGAFAGLSLEGAVVHERESLNGDYYQPGASAREIVLQGRWSNSNAEELRQSLARF